MIIDELMPRFDATRVDHVIVDAPVERAYEAVLRADFNEAFARSVPVRALVGVRTAIERAVAAVRGLDPPAPPEQLEPRASPTWRRTASTSASGKTRRARSPSG